jgi:hypothetical protein
VGSKIMAKSTTTHHKSKGKGRNGDTSGSSQACSGTSAELEDSTLVPFNVDASYPTSGGTPHGRYVKILIVFC